MADSDERLHQLEAVVGGLLEEVQALKEQKADNYITEAVAKDSWCPFASSRRVRPRQADNGSVQSRTVGFTGHNKAYVSTLCVADECLAWRWSGRENENGQKTGYCGLAGKP